MFICLNTFVETKLKIVEVSSFFGENLVLDKFGTDHWASFRVFDEQLMHFKVNLRNGSQPLFRIYLRVYCKKNDKNRTTHFRVNHGKQNVKLCTRY